MLGTIVHTRSVLSAHSS